MPVVATGLADGTVITDIINGTGITVHPASASIGATITCVPSPSYNDAIYVRNGYTNGGVNIYYDPFVKEGKTVPSWSKIPQQIRTTATTFDGDGTKFYDYRSSYVIPGQGENALRFPRLNVFD